MTAQNKSQLSDRAAAALQRCEETDIDMSMARTQRAMNRARVAHWDALRTLFHILSLKS